MIIYLLSAPLTCRHQKETRCLCVCVVKRLQLGEQRWLRLRSLTSGVRVARRMHDNRIGDAGAESLDRVLAQCTALANLNISGNDI